MKLISCLVLAAVLSGTLLFTGCIQSPEQRATYSVDNAGVLQITATTPVFEEKVLSEEENVT
jgi:hypothetical protein